MQQLCLGPLIEKGKRIKQENTPTVLFLDTYTNCKPKPSKVHLSKACKQNHTPRLLILKLWATQCYPVDQMWQLLQA